MRIIYGGAPINFAEGPVGGMVFTKRSSTSVARRRALGRRKRRDRQLLGNALFREVDSAAQLLQASHVNDWRVHGLKRRRTWYQAYMSYNLCRRYRGLSIVPFVGFTRVFPCPPRAELT